MISEKINISGLKIPFLATSIIPLEDIAPKATPKLAIIINVLKETTLEPIAEFRKECRAFAEKWIDVHKKQFMRLGVVGDWKNYYSTMSFDAEAQIVRELGKFLKEGSLYKGFKPVLWSTVEKTALADAEVEYQDHKLSLIHI